MFEQKNISKRMRSLGLNEVRTYTLVDKKTSDLFSKDKKVIEVPNPMSQDRSVLRKSMIPSLFLFKSSMFMYSVI